MKKYIFSFWIVSLILSDAKAIQPKQYWVDLFDQYAAGNHFAIATNDTPLNCNMSLTYIDFYTAMELRSQRGAIYIPKYEPSSCTVIKSVENSFEELSAGLNALVSMYEATGDVFYLEKVLDYAENLVDNSHLLASNETHAGYAAGQNYRGWEQYNWDPYVVTGTSIPNTTEEIKPFRYILKICRIIANKPSLSTYQNRSIALVEFIEKHVWEKWYYAGTCHEWTHRVNLHISCNWAFVAKDLYYLKTHNGIGLAGGPGITKLTNSALAEYYDHFSGYYDKNLLYYEDFVIDPTTGNGYFKLISKKCAPYHNNGYCIEQDRDINNIEPNCSLMAGDVSHGNFIVSYLIESHELSPNNPYTFDGHLKKLINTFQNILWKGCSGSPTSPARIPELMDGTYSNTATPTLCYGDVSNNGYDIGEGWIKLGRYSCSLQETFEEFIDCELSGNILHQYSSLSAIQMYANMALNSHYLTYSNSLYLDGNIPSDLYIANEVDVSSGGSATIDPTSQVIIKVTDHIEFKHGFQANASTSTAYILHAFVDPGMCESQNRMDINHSGNEANMQLPRTSTKDKDNVSFSVYPNPNNGTFVIEYNSQDAIGSTLMITDMLGRGIYSSRLNGYKETINLPDIEKGIYIITVRKNDQRQVTKVIIE